MGDTGHGADRGADWLLQAYREGRCRGMNELHEVRRLHGEHAEAVEAWVAQQSLVSRDRVATLREELASRSRPQLTLPAKTELIAGKASVVRHASHVRNHGYDTLVARSNER